MSTIAYRQLPALVEALGFTPLDAFRSVGEPAGVPTSMLVAVAHPLALLIRFRTDPHGTATLFDEWRSTLPADQCSFSIEGDSAWLSLKDAEALPHEAIAALVAYVSEKLAASDLAVPPGCLRCGDAATAQVTDVDGLPTRICPTCLGEAVREKQEVEAALNRPSFAATIGLPAVFGYAAVGWAVIWFAIGVILERNQIRVIPGDEFSFLLIVLIVGGAGWVLGWPLGRAVRQSVGLNRAPWVICPFIIAGAVFCGEVLTIALWLFYWVGIFDVRAALGMLGVALASYTKFWIGCKVAMLVCLGFFCFLSASERRSVSMQV